MYYLTKFGSGNVYLEQSHGFDKTKILAIVCNASPKSVSDIGDVWKVGLYNVVFQSEDIEDVIREACFYAL